MEMLLLELNPDEPYVPFVEPRDRPWWAYEASRGQAHVSRPRRILGRALIRAGQAVAAERQVTAIG